MPYFAALKFKADHGRSWYAFAYDREERFVGVAVPENPGRQTRSGGAGCIEAMASRTLRTKRSLSCGYVVSRREGVANDIASILSAQYSYPEAAQGTQEPHVLDKHYHLLRHVVCGNRSGPRVGFLVSQAPSGEAACNSVSGNRAASQEPSTEKGIGAVILESLRWSSSVEKTT